MGIRFQSVFSIAAAAVAIAAALPAAAQEASLVDVIDDEVYYVEDVDLYGVEFFTIPEGFDALFFDRSGDFYENRSINRQITFLTGGLNASFPEREIVWDADAIHEAYEVHSELQVSTTPLLRVPDLPNPYAFSLLTSPAYVGSSVVTGSEFIYEFTPMP